MLASAASAPAYVNRDLYVRLRVRSCDDETLLDFAGQVAYDDLLSTRPPDRIKEPKSTKPRKARDKASARAYTWTRPANARQGPHPLPIVCEELADSACLY